MAGQGGGSAYLAVLALCGIPYEGIPSIALACNVVVTLGIILHFFKAGHLKKRLIFPFTVTSIPAALAGGIIHLPELYFKIMLAAVLFAAAMIMFFWKDTDFRAELPSVRRALVIGPAIGIILGFIGAAVGIGGGILLFPLIVFMRWGTTKQAAMAGGYFTFANSVAGLIGHGVKGMVDAHILIPLGAVAIGSQIGAYLGAKKIPAVWVQRIFAVVLLFVAIRIVIQVV